MPGSARSPAADVFATASLRARVLDAWAASPARFREDANAEEDLALGAYRDRLVVELAQNAADAAVRAGRGPGRLLLRLTSHALVAANTGEPLDASGVEGLSTLRASAKREAAEEVVGRFGVGFAAVLAVTDEPQVLSTSGSVRWSAEHARALVDERSGAAPGLAAELARRGGALPVLRLPLPAHGHPPDGYDTAVVLPFRDATALGVARAALARLDAALLLTLPALGEVEVAVDLADEQTGRVLRARRDGQTVDVEDGAEVSRWRVVTASGRLDPSLLADRPTEERARRAWTVTCAVPVDEAGRPRPLPPSVPPVVHAPTPTDEPFGLPALLVASFPLEPTRRHVAQGPLADHLVSRCAETYAGLVADLPTHPSVLRLVPGPLPGGALDGMLRDAVRERLAETAFLPSAGEASLLRPRDAVVLGPQARGAASPAHLSTVLTGLVDPDWWRTHDRASALSALGVREVALADLVDGLAGVSLAPPAWRDLYAALDGADPDALGALPVPLADGRVVRGPRGLLMLPEPGEHADVLGLRIVHPEAAHRLLERLGAVRASPRALLDEPAVHAAVAASYDEDDPGPVADAVLALVAQAGLAPGDRPWLADLALPGVDGEWYPAGEMLLPGGTLASLVAPGAPFGLAAAHLVERWGRDVLTAVGVLGTYAVARDHDVLLEPDACAHDLHDEDEWVAHVRAGLPRGAVVLSELLAVRDLELTDPARWGDALAELSRPPLRDAVTVPGTALLPEGRTVRVRPYTAWWLGRHPVLEGRVPTDLHVGRDARLSGLYGEAPDGPDPEFLTAIGVRADLETLLAEPGGPDDLLARLADPSRPVTRARLRDVYAALAGVPAERVGPPAAVRAVRDDEVVVADPDEVVVVDAPDLLPLVGGRPVVVVPAAAAVAVADVLDVALASDTLPGRVESPGERRPVPVDVHAVLPDAPRSYLQHERLVVDGVEVRWRVADGEVHAVDAGGLARALAWVSACWERRHLAEAALRWPDGLATLLDEAAFED